MKYTTTFKKAVLRKVLPPENRSVHSVAVELGVGEMTIHRWFSQVKDGTISFEQGEENPSGQRNMTEKLNLLLEYQKNTSGTEWRMATAKRSARRTLKPVPAGNNETYGRQIRRQRPRNQRT